MGGKDHNWFRNLILRRFSQINIERARIAYRCINDLRRTARKDYVGFPIPVDEIRETLVDMGISVGDLIHLQSSCSHLFRGSLVNKLPGKISIVEYAGAIVKMLIDLVGKEGTVLMNTDSISTSVATEIWAGVQGPRTVFDYAKSPSRRGLISELFRRHTGVIRSIHPWYNVTGWGKHANELISQHYKSTPYAMDIHSPWYKITQRDGKVILLGRGFRGNSALHLMEYVYPQEFPRAVFLNKPIQMKYVDYDRSVKVMDVMLHAPLWKNGAEIKFCSYLNNKYGIYNVKQFHNDAWIVVYNAKDQYDAIYREMRNNITWYDPRFWP